MTRIGILNKLFLAACVLALVGAGSIPAWAGGKDNAAAEMARKLQNPLSGISAIMTENKFLFKSGNDKTTCQFDLEPIFSIDFPNQGFTLIPRAVIPIMGATPPSASTGQGEALPGDDDIKWGISDIITQFFFAPRVTSAWKWGLGAQVSLDTHTDDAAAGPGWGAGPSGILVGDITEHLSFAGIVGHLWSFDGEVSTTNIQPMFFYNLPTLPGAYVAYEAAISANWRAEDSDDIFTVPLGFVAGKAFDLGGGFGLDINLGPYWNVVKPDGAADWFLKFGLTILLP